MCGWRPGSRSAWGRVQAEPEHSGAKAVGAFAPGLKTYVPIGEENLFPPSPRARVRSTNTGVLRRGPGAPRSSPYGTSGRHWDLTETFLTPLRLQGFGAS